MPDAYAYIRVSTDKQTNSLDAQADTNRKAANYIGCELSDAHVLVDEARSGATRLMDRPAGKILMQCVQPGDTVIVTAVDRIARNLRDLLRTVDALVEKGVHIHVVNFGGGSLDMTSAVGRLMVQILGAVAEFERNICSERIRAVKANRKANGLKIARYIPPGRKPSDQRTPKGDIVFVHDETEWKLMAEVYHRHDILGETFYSIGKDFQRRGIKTNNGGPWVYFSKNGGGDGAKYKYMQTRYNIYKEWYESTNGKEITCKEGLVVIPVCGPTLPDDVARMPLSNATKMLARQSSESGYGS